MAFGDTPITVTTRDNGYGEHEVRLRIGNRTFILDRDLDRTKAEDVRNSIIDILDGSSFEVKSRVTSTV